MARKPIRISLGVKLRLLFGTAAAGIIAAALLVPWYFTELLSEREMQSTGEELTRLRKVEWLRRHATNPVAARNENSQLISLYTQGPPREDRQGPLIVPVESGDSGASPLSPSAREARDIFLKKKNQEFVLLKTEDSRGQRMLRFFRAIRAEKACMDCHGEGRKDLQFSRGQLVAMVDLSMPAGEAERPLVWWTRAAFVLGGILAGLLALVLFALITERLILRPLQKLRLVADRVAEGDLNVRSEIRTNDELQHLGDSFNQMLAAIAEQTEKLRSANLALDLKLSKLAESNVALFQANKLKSEFLANISHELRTPLNSIIGFADLLAASGDDKVQRYGGNIGSAARTLLNMINDLLDLAKIEAGKADVRFDKVSVTGLCQTMMDLMRPLAEKKQIELAGELPADVPIVVTDGGKLQQILYNLLSNAVKFTPPGGKVTVQAAYSGGKRAGKTREEVSVTVADTGPGISEADQAHIFEKFFQVERTLTKEVSGTGLGLAISRELASLIGGRLSLKSTPGHGAEFTVTVPVEVESRK